MRAFDFEYPGFTPSRKRVRASNKTIKRRIFCVVIIVLGLFIMFSSDFFLRIVGAGLFFFGICLFVIIGYAVEREY
jgi:hypothetical protein